MVVGAGEGLLDAPAGRELVVDGDAGSVYLLPSAARRSWGRRRMEELARDRRRFERERALPPVTRDGRWVTLLANAATGVEIRAALEAEADGIGLLRTELSFLEAGAWPTEAEHAAVLAPLLGPLQGLVATVRVLDFGSDKTPPFLAGTDARGIALLLEHPEALAAQLRAILRASEGADLRLLVPLVESANELRTVRGLLRAAAADVGWKERLPSMGAMIETPTGVRRANEIALEAEFLSIGTNDLVQYTLGLDRGEPLATARSAAEPVVLGLIAETVAAAHAAGLRLEICGESASVPELAALYVGLGVDELSAAPARLDELRTVVRALSAEQAAAVAAKALQARSAAESLELAATLLSGESRDEQGEVLGRLGRVRS
jgi:phosphoenolpyruvate-protein kinase (PTS system EI component)